MLVQPATEIGFLDQQRQANGIPGDLQEVPSLSEGCEQFTNEYQYAVGQYPHTEVPGQKGFTLWGQRAASVSDLAGNGVGLWGASLDENAWASDPLHLNELFNPAARYAWYGANRSGAGSFFSPRICMGVNPEDPFAPAPEPTPSEPGAQEPAGSGEGEGGESKPAFFSLPGDGARGIPPFEETASEEPYSPQQAAHIPQDQATGYNIILFDVGTVARLLSATLTGPDGQGVAVRVVGPSTPAPKSPPGWPAVSTMGAYSGDDQFVIPVRPLAGHATYDLRATWAWTSKGQEEEQAQVVSFTTDCTTAELDPFLRPPRVRGCRHLLVAEEP